MYRVLSIQEIEIQENCSLYGVALGNEKKGPVLCTLVTMGRKGSWLMVGRQVAATRRGRSIRHLHFDVDTGRGLASALRLLDDSRQWLKYSRVQCKETSANSVAIPRSVLCCENPLG